MKMPDEIGVCKFIDGTYEVMTTSVDVPPNTKYIRHDIHEGKIEVLRRIISGLEADIRKLKGK